MQLQGETTFKNKFSSADVSFTITPTNNTFVLETNNLQLDHPLISNKAITLSPSSIQGIYTQPELDATLKIGEGNIQISGTLEPQTKTYDLEILFSELPLQEVISWFHLPEATKVSIDGILTGVLTVSGPPLKWSFTLEEPQLSTKGTLFSAASLTNGSFVYKPINAESPRRTGPETRTWTPFIHLGWMSKATIAAEDAMFWSHPGYNFTAIQTIIDEYAAGEKKLRGGSTITQQLAKNLFVGQQRTIERKLRELLYTLELERLLKKEEIISLYLNIVEFGPGIYGIKDAANTYFLQDPKNLSPKEAAYLASVLPSPSYHFKKVQRSGKTSSWKVNIILENMRRLKHLSTSEYQKAKAQTLRVIPPPKK